MSIQDSGSARHISSGNEPQATQALQQPQIQPQQPDPMFDRGRALFTRLQANDVQEYENFIKLNDVQMTSQISALQHWINLNGPQNQDETQLSRLYLKRLKKIKQQEAKRIFKLPEFLIKLTNLCQVVLGQSSQQQSLLAKNKIGVLVIIVLWIIAQLVRWWRR